MNRNQTPSLGKWSRPTLFTNKTMKIDVISLGLGPEHLFAHYLKLINEADVLAGAFEALAPFEHKEKIILGKDLPAFTEQLELACAQGKRVAVLASGDALFYGLGASLRKNFALADKLRFWPNVSSFQAAAASLGLPWGELASLSCLSLHGRKRPRDWWPLWQAMCRHKYIALLTDATNSPGQVAKRLLEKGATNFKLHVFENLTPCQSKNLQAPHYQTLSLEQGLIAQDLHFKQPAMLILENLQESAPRPVLGLPDEEIICQPGMPMTKGPVRAEALAALQLKAQHILWDLGAGSGSLSLEASALLPEGMVFAVERDKGRCEVIKENRCKFGAWNIEVVNLDLLDAIIDLPTPDCIFLGGGLGIAEEGPDSKAHLILEKICQKLKPNGRLIVNCVLLSSLNCCLQKFASLNWPCGALGLQISQTEPLGSGLRFIPLNPVFMVWAKKPMD